MTAPEMEDELRPEDVEAAALAISADMQRQTGIHTLTIVGPHEYREAPADELVLDLRDLARAAILCDRRRRAPQPSAVVDDAMVHAALAGWLPNHQWETQKERMRRALTAALAPAQPSASDTERARLMDALRPFLDEAERWAKWVAEFGASDYELARRMGQVSVSALLSLRALLAELKGKDGER